MPPRPPDLREYGPGGVRRHLWDFSGTLRQDRASAGRLAATRRPRRWRRRRARRLTPICTALAAELLRGRGRAFVLPRGPLCAAARCCRRRARQLDRGASIRSRCGPVPQVGQDSPAAVRLQGVGDLAPQRTRIEPLVVVRVGVLGPEFVPERGGSQEAARPGGLHRASADPQDIRQARRQPFRMGGRRPVDRDAQPRTAVRRRQLSDPVSARIGQPLPGDRFQPHPSIMPGHCRTVPGGRPWPSGVSSSGSARGRRTTRCTAGG